MCAQKQRNKVATNSDNRLRAQTIRLQRRICPIVRAIPLEQVITNSTSYYRYECILYVFYV